MPSDHRAPCTSQDGATSSALNLWDRSEQEQREGYPHLVEMGEHATAGGYSVDGEFEFGLDLILEGLSAFE